MVKFELELGDGKKVECKTKLALKELQRDIEKLNFRSAKLVSYNGKRI